VVGIVGSGWEDFGFGNLKVQQRRNNHPVILSTYNVILSTYNVILSEAKDPLG
jgi:hypothetical protein